MTFTTVGELKAFLANIDDSTPLARRSPSESWTNALDVESTELVTIGDGDERLTVSMDGFWKDKCKFFTHSTPFKAVTFN